MSFRVLAKFRKSFIRTFVSVKFSTVSSNSNDLYELPSRSSRYKPLDKDKLLNRGVKIDITQDAIRLPHDKPCPISRVSVNQLAANDPCQDKWDFGLTQIDGVASNIQFCILDGFAGLPCVSLLAWALLDFTAASLLSRDQLALVDQFWQGHDASLQPYHLHRRLPLVKTDGKVGYGTSPPSKFLTTRFRTKLRAYVTHLLAERKEEILSPSACLSEAFCRLDAELCLAARGQGDDESCRVASDLLKALSATSSVASTHMQCGQSIPMPFHDLLHLALTGATATAGCITWPSSSSHSDSSSRPTLSLANAGNCQAVLYRQLDGALHAYASTIPHDLSVNDSECSRLCANHTDNKPSDLIRPKSGEGGQQRLLLGELSTSRAFGAVRYKWPASRLLQLSSWPGCTDPMHLTQPLPEPYTSSPYLSAEPETLDIELTPSDRYLVLATDDFWTRLTPNKVAQLLQLEPDSDNPASLLLWSCLNAHSSSSSSPTSPKLRPRKHSVLPYGIARYTRDDITVMVIELAH